MKYLKLFEYKRFTETLKEGDIFKLKVSREKEFVVEVIEKRNFSFTLNIILTYSFKRRRWITFDDPSSKIEPLESFVNTHGEALTVEELERFGNKIEAYRLQQDANKYNL